jgi:ribosomal protein S18 acetylase RimI-like enzyme
MLIIEPFTGERSRIRAFFGQADDSASEIAGYIEAGEVLVAQREGAIVGHVQFIPSDVHWEIKSIAVLESSRRQGIGTAMVNAARERALSKGGTQLVVGTATADIGNLCFYQRLGFRMVRIERDVFTAERGYAELESNGIRVRDRVWFSMALNGSAADEGAGARSALSPNEPLKPERIKIRPAVLADADGIARIFLESAEYHAGLDPERYWTPAVETITARYREGRQHPADAVGASTTLVAVFAGEIVGFVDTRLERSPDPMHQEIVYCHVAEIAVGSPHQNRGIGGQLLRAAEEWGRRQGSQFASLEYHAANARASEFYRRRMGYRIAAITAIKNL